MVNKYTERYKKNGSALQKSQAQSGAITWLHMFEKEGFDFYYNGKKWQKHFRFPNSAGIKKEELSEEELAYTRQHDFDQLYKDKKERKPIERRNPNLYGSSFDATCCLRGFRN